MCSRSKFCFSDTLRFPASASSAAAFPLRNSSLFFLHPPPQHLAGPLLVPVQVCEGKALQLQACQ